MNRPQIDRAFRDEYRQVMTIRRTQTGSLSLTRRTGRGWPLCLLAFASLFWCQPTWADPGHALPFELGPKNSSDHRIKAVVGPTVQIDEESRLSMSWMVEEHDVRKVYFARQTVPGGPMGPSVPIHGPSETPYWRQESPAVVVDGDHVYVTWAKAHPQATPETPFSSELRLSRSADGGQTFAPSIRVNDDDTVINHTFDALHRASDGNLYFSWIDGREGKKDPATFVAHSPDRGHTVTANVKVDESTCVCCRTALASAPDGTLYVAWRKVLGDVREVVVARSDDGGQTFSSSAIVGHDEWVFPSCPHRPASMGVDQQGRLYIAWYTEGADETPAVYFAYSDDRGRSFSPKRQLNLAKGTFPDHPQMAVDPAGRVVVVWEEQSPVRREVVVSVSLDRGNVFTAPHKLNEKRGQTPTVAVNRQGVFVLGWMEHAMPSYRLIAQTLRFPAVTMASEGGRIHVP